MGGGGDAVRGGVASVGGRGSSDEGVDGHGEVVIGGSEDDLLGGKVRGGGRGD
jgi:hypothetical protein